jgi:DHA1 family tetracycline resistance protein-like MFS transporter
MSQADTSPPAAPPSSPSQRASLAIVFLVVVIDLLGFGIVLPLLPVFASEYVTQAFGEPRAGLGGLIVGLLMASFSAMQFLFAPVWGRVSDRVGRRPILLLGLAGSVVFYALFGYASDLDPKTHATAALALLFLSRIGAGIAGATISTAQAVIADCTPPEKRKHGMAMIGMAFGIGFTFGPLVGFAALLWAPGTRGAIGYTAAGLSALALALGAVLLRETRDFRAAPPLRRGWLDMTAVRHALASPAVGPVVLTFFLASVGFSSFEVTLSLQNKDALKLGDRDNFLIFAYVGFVLALTQGGLYRPVAKHLSEPTLMAIGLVLMGLGCLALGGVMYLAAGGGLAFGTLLTLQMISLAMAVVGFAFLTPSAQALVSRRSDPARQGEILGVNQSASSMARILGAFLGPTLYKATETHLLPYLFGAAILLLMLPLMPRIRRGG